ncbi:MAG: DUF559 domain-containing protein [Solirubrobacterales bacterium]
MGDKPANPDLVAARIAARQHGVVSHRQLLAAGLSRNSVSKRCGKGRLHRVHRGVYAVGHPGLSSQGRWMAAVLACGDAAVLSHLSAAGLWSLLPTPSGPVHVSIPTGSGRDKRPGIRIHRCAALTPDLVTRRLSIPVTTPARTIADLRGTIPAAQLRRAIRQAEVLGLQTGLDESSEPTRSELEHLFLRLCRRHRLPTPEVNVRIGSREVDFLWREHRVVVETDGYRYHRGSTAFEDDHDRDLELHTEGFDVLRFTYRQVTSTPERVGAAIDESLQGG